MEDEIERQKLYDTCREDLLKRQLSNSENFDKSVLALSSGLLAASIAFIKPSGPGAGTWHPGILAWSWVALGFAIAGTMASFMISQMAVDRQLEYAEKYYLRKQNDALTAANKPAVWTIRLNRFAGFAFGVGVILTVWFAILSIQPR